MRTQIKRRMLALWLSVCMILTMMPSMAVPAFADIIKLTVNVDEDTGVVGVTDVQAQGTKLYYTVVEQNPKAVVDAWVTDTTIYNEATQKQIEGSVWANFESGNLTLNYDEHNGKYLVVAEVKDTDNKIHAAYSGQIKINSPHTTGTFSVKSKEVSLGNAITEEQAKSGVSLNAESRNVGSVYLTYAEAMNTDAERVAFTPDESSAGATAKAYIFKNALSESADNFINNLIKDDNSEAYDEIDDLKSDKEPLGGDKTYVDKWIIFEVTAQNGTKEYYVVKAEIEAGDQTNTLTSAAIKGTEITPLIPIAEVDAEKVDMTLTGDDIKYSEITISYEDAIDKNSVVFTCEPDPENTNAKIKASIVQYAKVNKTLKSANVKEALSVMDSGRALEGVKAIPDVEGNDAYLKGNEKWAVIQVDPEIGNDTYYIVRIIIKKAVGAAELENAYVKGVEATLGDIITKDENGKYLANLSAGQHARGSVRLTYKEATKDENAENKVVKFAGECSEGATVKAVKVEAEQIDDLSSVDVADKFTENENANTIYDSTNAGNADYEKAITNKKDGDNFWILVRVTAKNTVDINYYAINVAVGEASDKAELLDKKVTIKGKEVDTPPAIADKDADKVDLGNSENYSEITLSYEQASSTTLDTFVGNCSPEATVTVAAKTLGITKTEQVKTTAANGDVSGKNALSTNENGDDIWLVVKVTPENGVAAKENYYVFKVHVDRQYVVADTPGVGDVDTGDLTAEQKGDVFDPGNLKNNLKIEDVTLPSSKDLDAILTEKALDVSVDYPLDDLKKVSPYKDWGNNLYVHIETVLDITVEEHPDAKSVTYDVQPKYRVVATDAEEKGKQKNLVELESYTDLEIPDGKNVWVTLPLPTDMTKDTYYITHYAKTGSYVYKWKGITGNLSSISFNNPHGFSKFVISEDDPTVAVVGDTNYLSFKEAVAAAVAAGESKVTLNKKPAEGDYPAVVNDAIKLSLEVDTDNGSWKNPTKEEVEALLTNGSSVTMTSEGDKFETDHTVTFKFEEINSQGGTTPGGSDTPNPPAISGDLTVSKTVAGDEGDKTKEFNFTVTLSDTKITGTYGAMEFANGVATFKLKDGQSAKAVNLPKDITYTVAETEANQDGYTTTSTGAAGTIIAGGNATAAFTNTKGNVSPEPTIEPSENGKLVFKVAAQERDLKDRSTTDKDCTLKLAADDGDDIVDMKVESSDPKVVRVLKDNKLRYMDLGTADITVTATGKSGKTYTITFPVKVTKLGRPTLTVSNKISKTARTFTVTTSTVRGADGFIVKYSLKKNMSNSGKKKYACGKKLKRQPITVKKGKTTYYVKVRAYKKVDGKIVKYAWSKETEKIKSR